jgi:hypothetical protein
LTYSGTAAVSGARFDIFSRRSETGYAGRSYASMEDGDLKARGEQALVVVTLSTATLIACVSLLLSGL